VLPLFDERQYREIQTFQTSLPFLNAAAVSIASGQAFAGERPMCQPESVDAACASTRLADSQRRRHEA
jgi:hypothetical protein